MQHLVLLSFFLLGYFSHADGECPLLTEKLLNGEPIDKIITVVHQDRALTEETEAVIKKHGPDVPVLFITGQGAYYSTFPDLPNPRASLFSLSGALTNHTQDTTYRVNAEHVVLCGGGAGTCLARNTTQVIRQFQKNDRPHLLLEFEGEAIWGGTRTYQNLLKLALEKFDHWKVIDFEQHADHTLHDLSALYYPHKDLQIKINYNNGVSREPTSKELANKAKADEGIREMDEFEARHGEFIKHLRKHWPPRRND